MTPTSKLGTTYIGFNGHPPLGVNATSTRHYLKKSSASFQWAPTLGGECYFPRQLSDGRWCGLLFQWAPTLGGECYRFTSGKSATRLLQFQWAPTLGGECYPRSSWMSTTSTQKSRFNGHPPLGVNATRETRRKTKKTPAERFNGHPPLGVNATDVVEQVRTLLAEFQWAPTLGGECYFASQGIPNTR